MNDEFTSWISRHTLALLISTNAPGSSGFALKSGTRCTTFSSHIMDFDGRWAIITAGHILDKLKSLKSCGHNIKTNIIDCHSSAAVFKQVVPYDIDFENIIWFNEADGLDIAIIPSDNVTKECLKKNGIEAVPSEDYKTIPNDFDRLCIVGFQNAMNKSAQEIGNTIHTVLTTTLVYAKPLEASSKDGFLRRWEIPNNPTATNTEQNSIVGMSGGPVFAIKQTDDKRWRYWLYAIQTDWNKESRIGWGAHSSVAPLIVHRFHKSLREKIEGENESA